MSAAKFEKLIDLIINEDQERAEQLFHEIVVEKSREIYENLMSEEDLDEDSVTGMLDEIEAEEEDAEMSMNEETVEDEEISGDFDVEDDMEDEEDMDDMEDEAMDDMGDEDMEDMADGDHATKDDIMDLEDKLDQLLAAFEEEFGAEEEGEEEEEEGEEEGEEEEEEEGEDEVMEAVEMKKVPVSHTDGTDSKSSKSMTNFGSGKAGMQGAPVNFSGGGDEKGRSAPSSKEVGMKFKNAPGGDGSKTEAAPKPVTAQASGVNTRDVVPESRRSKKRMIK